MAGAAEEAAAVSRLVLWCCCLVLAVSVRAQALAGQDVADFVRAGPRPDLPMEGKGVATADREPQQVHFTLAGPHRVRVSWVTMDMSTPAIVQYGREPGVYTEEARGDSLTYSYVMYRSGLIHHVVLGADNPLEDNATYYYRLGGEGRELSFKTPPPMGPDTPIKFHVVGDLGQTGWSVSTLEHMAQSPHDAVINVGDLSYADRYQPRWDSWGRLISPLASTRPWMVVQGNHEIESLWGLEPSFKAYNARWPNPALESNSSSNLFYSFDVAGVHYLMLGSYADYDEGSPQYRWLQADLASIDRAKTPWLIAVLHAPWYNSNSAHQGDGEGMRQSLEKLLVGARTDLLFAGHVHAYERTARVSDLQLDPCGVMHITIGDGGNREGLAGTYLKPQPPWSLKREASFGHGELEILDRETARWTWHRNQDDEAVVADELVIKSLSAPRSKCKLPSRGLQEAHHAVAQY